MTTNDPLVPIKQIPFIGRLVSLAHNAYDALSGNTGHYEGDALSAYYVSDGPANKGPKLVDDDEDHNPGPDQDENLKQGGPQGVTLDESNKVTTDQNSSTSGTSRSSSSGSSSAREGSVSEVVSTSNNATQANTLEQASSASAPSSAVVEVQSNAAQQYQFAQSLAGNNVTLSPVITVDASDNYAPVANRTSDSGWLSIIALSAVALGVVYMMPRDTKGKYAKYAAKAATKGVKVSKWR